MIVSNNNKLITGNNKDFYAIWSATTQKYTIYKAGKFIKNAFRYKDVLTYIN